MQRFTIFDGKSKKLEVTSENYVISIAKFQVTEAPGDSFNEKYFQKEEQRFDIRDFGAGTDQSLVENTKAINSAIQKASVNGGTVIIPKGDFRVYTIHLMIGANIYMSEGSTLHAAKTDIKNSYELQIGEGGNYEEPEANLYIGLQDHGHAYLTNNLIYGVDIHDVMIYGPGLIDGSAINDEGELENVLMGGDPLEPIRRTDAGHGQNVIFLRIIELVEYLWI